MNPILGEDLSKTTDGETTFIKQVLENNYGDIIYSLEPLLLKPDKRIFKITTDKGITWVVRAYAPDTSRIEVEDYIRNLLFLEKHNFPAERLIRTKAQENFVEVDDWNFLVTSFVSGKKLDSSSESFKLLGETLGKLHSINLADSLEIPKSKMLPRKEINYALSELAKVKSQVPENLISRFEYLESELNKLNFGEDLPEVFIHSDCHPSNAVRVNLGEVVLFDWQESGLGPAVMDLAYLLLSCDRMAPWLHQDALNDPDPWPEERIKAVIEGYKKYFTLTQKDLNLLPDMLRFRSLIFGAVNFSRLVKGQTKDDESLWWWKRFNASNEIANKTQKYVLSVQQD